MNGVLHGADDDRLAVDLAASIDDGVVQPGVGNCLLQPSGIRLEVGELQGIGGNQVAVFGPELAVVKQVSEAGPGVDAEVALALGADIEVLVEVLLPDNLAALVALDPEALGFNALLARGIEFRLFPLKPCHKSNLRILCLRSAADWQRGPDPFDRRERIGDFHN